MQYLLKKTLDKTMQPGFLFGIIGLLTVILFDKLYWGLGILKEGRPIVSVLHIVRSSIIFLSTLLMIRSCLGKVHSNFISMLSKEFSFERLSMVIVQLISALILVLFFSNIKAFHELALEDSFIEWGSFSFMFLCCILFAGSFLYSRKYSKTKTLFSLLLLLFTLVFFILAMEEVSWLQRLRNINGVPYAFRWNSQGETNLHNFATNFSETVFYFFIFIFFCIFPFVRLRYNTHFTDGFTKVFLPRPFIAIPGAFVCAYNYDMWNIVFTQVAFFGAIIIMGYFIIYPGNRIDRLYASCSTIIIVVMQACFLFYGNKFFGISVITEYKEFIIALVCLIYALDVFRNVKIVQTE